MEAQSKPVPFNMPVPAFSLSPASSLNLLTSSLCLIKFDPFYASSDQEKSHDVTPIPPAPLPLNSFCFKQAGIREEVTTRSGAGGCSEVEELRSPPRAT